MALRFDISCCFFFVFKFLETCIISLLQVSEVAITIDDNDEDSESPLARRKVSRTRRRRLKDVSVCVFHMTISTTTTPTTSATLLSTAISPLISVLMPLML